LHDHHTIYLCGGLTAKMAQAVAHALSKKTIMRNDQEA